MPCISSVPLLLSGPFGMAGLTRNVTRPAGDARGRPDGTIVSVPYDEDLAVRIREIVGSEPDLTEKKMFGGLAFSFGETWRLQQAAKVACWFASTRRHPASSSRRRALIPWRCAVEQ